MPQCSIQSQFQKMYFAENLLIKNNTLCNASVEVVFELFVQKLEKRQKVLLKIKACLKKKQLSRAQTTHPFFKSRYSSPLFYFFSHNYFIRKTAESEQNLKCSDCFKFFGGSCSFLKPNPA